MQPDVDRLAFENQDRPVLPGGYAEAADGRLGGMGGLATRRHRSTQAAPLVLLLQGPVGPFFGRLARAFERAGCTILKVNFNGGDWLFYRRRSAINFAGPPRAFDDWLRDLIRRRRPAAIVLFGEGRPYHLVAMSIATRARIPVWCLEEGYSRPDFVTCERSGNNARSPLRHTWHTGRGHRPEAATVPVTGDTFSAVAIHATLHAIAKGFGRPFFRASVSHRDRGLRSEALLWTRSFLRKIVHRRTNRDLVQHLTEQLRERFFVVALQVHDDLHLLRNGLGWTMERLITETIHSFAREADAAHHLVFKVHPLDRGHTSYRNVVACLAELLGCAGRIHVVDDGSIGPLIRNSRGVVTVNSTSALLAMNHGKPVLALGDAIYTGSGLTFDAAPGDYGALDRFWCGGSPPDRERVALFMRRMREDSQINGSFYLRAWLDDTSERIATRVTSDILSTAVLRRDRLPQGAADAPRAAVAANAGRRERELQP